ncbi:uncharacterized protein LOC144124983 [Amblyomma americanum]
MEIRLLLTPLGALLVASTCWAAPESGRSDEGCALTTCIPEECEMMGSVCVENSCGQLECVSQSTAHHAGQCPYVGTAPDAECEDGASDTTCENLDCQKQGKVCCPDSCGYMRCT